MDSFAKGSFIAPIDASSPPCRITAATDPEPWPDGSQYTEYTLGDDRKTDVLRAISTRDGRVLHQMPLPHFSGSELRPSPISKTTVLTSRRVGATGAAVAAERQH